MTYRDDPQEITAKFAGKCSHPGCAVPVSKGDRVTYYPKTHRVFGEKCGHGADAARAFDAARFDEDFAPQAL